jgi:hypothetical protein
MAREFHVAADQRALPSGLIQRQTRQSHPALDLARQLLAEGRLLAVVEVGVQGGAAAASLGEQRRRPSVAIPKSAEVGEADRRIFGHEALNHSAVTKRCCTKRYLLV